FLQALPDERRILLPVEGEDAFLDRQAVPEIGPHLRRQRRRRHLAPRQRLEAADRPVELEILRLGIEFRHGLGPGEMELAVYVGYPDLVVLHAALDDRRDDV